MVTTDGLPLAYEVLPGNTADKTTLRHFLAKSEGLYGKARRVWVMDRGIPTEETLAQMRQEGVAYLVGTPRHQLRKLEQQLLERPWERVHQGVQVKLLQQEQELYVLAQSVDRRKKEQAMRRRKLKRLIRGLNRLKRRVVTRDTLLKKVAVLQQEAAGVARFVKVREPKAGQPVNRQTFVCRLDRSAWKQAGGRDGCYLLRGYLPWADFPQDLDRQAPMLWSWYTQLVQVEEAFKTLKGDLHLRPIHHQVEPRVEAYIFVAFLGYCLMATLRMRLRAAAPGLTPRAVLEKFSAIRMVDVCIPTTDGRLLIMPRYIEPEANQQLVLDKLGLTMPPWPPPRIRGGEMVLPASPSAPVSSPASESDHPVAVGADQTCSADL